MKKCNIVPIIIASVIVLAVPLIILFFTLFKEDTTQLAKDEFSQYYDGENDTVILNCGTLHFETHSIDLDGLLPNEDFNGGVIVKKNKFYFSTNKTISLGNHILNIYESNLAGTDVKLFYTKDGYKTHATVVGFDNAFYIDHCTENLLVEDSRVIDLYSIDTNEYVRIDSGKECKISDHIPTYSSNQYKIELLEEGSQDQRGRFVITDLETNKVREIDDDFLARTMYIDSMQRFGYSPSRYDISNGHILLTYSIGAGNGWNYSHLVYEYNFEDNKLEYKLLAFPDDRLPLETIDIIYIN